MAEFASLRQFIAEASTGAIVANAVQNGSVHDHGPTATSAPTYDVLDDAGEPHRSDDTAALTADDAREPAERYRSGTPADDAREPPTDERRDETDAGDGKVVLHNPSVSADDDRPDEPEACDANVLYDPPSQIETPAAVVMASDDTALASRPADNAAERPADERRGEPDAGDVVPYIPLVSAGCNQADATDSKADDAPIYQPNDRERPPADDVPGPETPNAGANDAGETPERPPEGTLLARILEAIETSQRPRRSWQIERELGMSRPLSSELSKLVKIGCVVRLKEGVFGIAGRDYPDYGSSVSSEANSS
jgi:hypothetical protein